MKLSNILYLNIDATLFLYSFQFFRVRESSEWFTSLEKSKQTLTYYEGKIEELRGEFNRLKKTEFHMLTCSHVVDFVTNCEQLIRLIQTIKKRQQINNTGHATMLFQINSLDGHQ